MDINEIEKRRMELIKKLQENGLQMEELKNQSIWMDILPAIGISLLSLTALLILFWLVKELV